MIDRAVKSSRPAAAAAIEVQGLGDVVNGSMSMGKSISVSMSMNMKKNGSGGDHGHGNSRCSLIRTINVLGLCTLIVACFISGSRLNAKKSKAETFRTGPATPSTSIESPLNPVIIGTLSTNSSSFSVRGGTSGSGVHVSSNLRSGYDNDNRAYVDVMVWW